MERLFVYADFDWLNEPALVGELSHERLRGSDTYGFKFADEWLVEHGGMFFCADLNNYAGWQYTPMGRDIFGMFADALPDRWGRTLVLRREQIAAQEENRPVKKLSSFDYLVGIDDGGRMGALRFKYEQGGEFINSDSVLRVPPITELRELIHASEMIEQSEAASKLPEKRWVVQLMRPGTSLGGARPKANVLDNQNVMYIAKFPSRSDEYDVALWEHFAHIMARKAGIDVAETKVVKMGGRFHTLLSRRFDRTAEGRRIHFASALSLLGLVDGCNATTGNGYLDIVDFILSSGTDVELNLQELYRRIAFNICIGNSDDHFRNHGFLLSKKGWTLSPAYDLNPTTATHQALLISDSSSEANLDVLLAAHQSYFLAKDVAAALIAQVKSAMCGWENVAKSLMLPPHEIKLFSNRVIKGCSLF